MSGEGEPFKLAEDSGGSALIDGEDFDGKDSKSVRARDARRVRLSPQARKIVSEYLDTTYGHECEVCRMPERLEIHHVDGNPANNTIANLRWRCKPHNVA